MQPSEPKKNLALIIVLIVVVLSVVAGGLYYLQKQNNKQQMAPVYNQLPKAATGSTVTNPKQSTTSGQKKVKVNLTAGLAAKEDIVECLPEWAQVVTDAVTRNTKAVSALEKCSTDACIQEVKDANSNLLNLVNKYCK